MQEIVHTASTLTNYQTASIHKLAGFRILFANHSIWTDKQLEEAEKGFFGFGSNVILMRGQGEE